MKTIHKLVLKSYLGPMVLTFFIVMFVLMMSFLWQFIDNLAGKGLSAWTIIELLGYAMTNMIPMGLPLATLLAAIMTMGNLGENYELLAMKSAGMSLMRIIQPLLWVVSIVAIGSFFVANNLVPAANRKLFRMQYDINQMKQTLQFRDGLFFNGIDNMSIRVGHQDPDTGLLTDVLIYDNRDPNTGASSGVMTATLADSGYIRLTDDKRFLQVLLYNGYRYQGNRTQNQWYNNSQLQRTTFDKVENFVSVSGFEMEQTDEGLFASKVETLNINQLQHEIDSLSAEVNVETTRSYDPLIKKSLFVRDTSVLEHTSGLHPALLIDSIPHLDVRQKEKLWSEATREARNARNLLAFDENRTKAMLTRLYGDQVEWQRKWALPISIIIFFLIGAPLGAIIRKGGLGMPIVVSIGFFLVYYIVSVSGETMAKEGTVSPLFGMWLSSSVLLPIAVYLTYKATNDAGLLDVEWYRIQLQKLKLWFSRKKAPQKTTTPSV